MKTPLEKYLNDKDYRMFVDSMTKLLLDAYYTPSELREMVILACIEYERYRLKRFWFIDKKYEDEVVEALDTLGKWSNTMDVWERTLRRKPYDRETDMGKESDQGLRPEGAEDQPGSIQQPKPPDDCDSV
jgi:hypothetical protein